MPFAMVIDGAHVSLEASVARGRVKVSVDKIDFEGALGSAAFHPTPEEMETLRDAVALVARNREYSDRSAVLRRHAEAMDGLASEHTGDDWCASYFEAIARRAREEAHKSERAAGQVKAELDALKPAQPTA